MQREITVWYDEESDYLEVIFEKQAGYFKETDHDSVMEKIDDSGKVIGFSVLKAKGEKNRSITAHLKNIPA